MGYYGNGFFYLRFRRQLFGHSKLGDWWAFFLKKLLFNFVGCFLVYLFLGSFFITKVRKVEHVCDGIKNHVVVKNHVF